MRITDRDGVIRTDDYSVNRIGRIVELSPGDIDINNRLLIPYEGDLKGKAMYTSWVKHVMYTADGIIIGTENSIYYLVEKDKADKYGGEV